VGQQPSVSERGLSGTSQKKTKIAVSRSTDYQPNTAVAGSPFEVADRAPNLPGGGSATTIYDERDRATEVQVRDVSGELVNRALRTYDAQGHIIEEKQILDNPETMFPAEAWAKMLEHFNDLIRKGNPKAKLVVVDPNLDGVVNRVCQTLQLSQSGLKVCRIAGLDCRDAGRVLFVKAKSEDIDTKRLAGLLAD
jgi:hypothetical protein